MLEDEKFDQKEVYANNVRIYRQFGRIYEASSDIPKLYAMPALKMKGYYVIKGAKHEGENQKED